MDKNIRSLEEILILLRVRAHLSIDVTRFAFEDMKTIVQTASVNGTTITLTSTAQLPIDDLVLLCRMGRGAVTIQD